MILILISRILNCAVCTTDSVAQSIQQIRKLEGKFDLVLFTNLILRTLFK